MNARGKFWLISVCALLAVMATLALGRWQLSRAAQKEALRSSMEAKAALPALDGAALAALAYPASGLHRRVLLRGHWLAGHTLFLDNRQMQGRAGFYVITPLQLEDSAAVVLVQRGWVARNFLDRKAVPTLETPAGVVQIEGRIAPPPGKLYELGGNELGRIRQNLDLAQLRAEWRLPLAVVSVQQTGAPSEGLLREWPAPNTGVDTHYGYAFQWFALSGLIAILYVWFQIVRRFLSPPRG